MTNKTTMIAANYKVYAFFHNISAIPMNVNNAYLELLDNGITILSDASNKPLCVLSGNYAIFRVSDKEIK